MSANNPIKKAINEEYEKGQTQWKFLEEAQGGYYLAPDLIRFGEKVCERLLSELQVFCRECTKYHRISELVKRNENFFCPNIKDSTLIILSYREEGNLP